MNANEESESIETGSSFSSEIKGRKNLAFSP
jgi:hypothetical protein